MKIIYKDVKFYRGKRLGSGGILAYGKKIAILLMIFCAFTCQMSDADVIRRDFLQLIKHGNSTVSENLKAGLHNYDLWWRTLSSRQKRIARLVDKVEKEYKSTHAQRPIEFTEANVVEISNQVGVINLLDIEVVEQRVQQHINMYNSAIKSEEMNKGIDKTIKNPLQEGIHSLLNRRAHPLHSCLVFSVV